MKFSPVVATLFLASAGFLASFAHGEEKKTAEEKPAPVAPISEDRGSAVLTASDSFGFRFSVDELGLLGRITTKMHMYRSVKEEAPLMAYLYSDWDGQVGRIFAQTYAFISKEDGKSVTREVTFPPPRGVVLRPGEHYWLVIDSPTGSEVTWQTAEGKMTRFYRNLWNGERRYDEGSLAANFSIEMLDLPPELAEAEAERAQRLAAAAEAGRAAAKEAASKAEAGDQKAPAVSDS